MSGHVVPIRTYFTIFILLMVLLFITYAASLVNLGPHGSLNLAIAMTIAIVKATLIILFFMHVKYSSRLVWVYAGASFVWLLIMFAITFGDYLTRGWMPVSHY